MFVTLSPLQRPPGRGTFARIRKRLLDKIKPLPPAVTRVQVAGSFFTDIRLYAPEGRIGEEDERLVRRAGHLVLCAPDLIMPAGCRPAVDSRQMERLMASILCNTAAKVLQQCRVPLYRRCIGIIDTQCAYPQHLMKLIKYAPQVLVYTQNPDAYQEYAEQCLDEFGAPVTIAEEVQALRRATLAVSFSDSALPSLYPLPVLSLFAARDSGVNLIVNDFDFALPETPELLPPGVNSWAFHTALYECCGINKISALCATGARCGKRTVALHDIAEQIARNQVQTILVQ